MDTAASHFTVLVESYLPPFDSERRFIEAEHRHVRGQLSLLKNKKSPLMTHIVPTLMGEPTAAKWKHYLSQLEHYGERLDKLEAEIRDGLIPVKFFVLNATAARDERIQIQIRVEAGSIHPAKHPPLRPARVDNGPEHQPGWKPAAATAPAIVKALTGTGFSRSDIKIASESLGAVFSQLDADDSADVVNEVLYIATTPNTHFTYEIRSKALPTIERGDVLVVE